MILVKFVLSDVFGFEVQTPQICKKNAMVMGPVLIIDDLAHKNLGTFWHI